MTETTAPKKLLEQNIVWFALGMIAMAVGGTIAFQSYLEGVIDERVQDPRINTALANEPLTEARVVDLVRANDRTGLSEARAVEVFGEEFTGKLGLLRREVARKIDEDATRIAQEQVASLEDAFGRRIDRLQDALDQFPDVKGLVLAFDRSEDRGGDMAGGACPEGWTIFRDAGGRVIVGAGQHSNTDENDVPLTRYPAFSDNTLDATGGEERHRLTINEMPSHNHGGVWGGEAKKAGMNNDYAYHTAGHVQTASQGGDEAHNNMPPYIALYFCKKESR